MRVLTAESTQCKSHISLSHISQAPSSCSSRSPSHTFLLPHSLLCIPHPSQEIYCYQTSACALTFIYHRLTILCLLHQPTFPHPLQEMVARKSPADVKAIHVLSSGLKAAATWSRVEALQNCREVRGPHMFEGGRRHHIYTSKGCAEVPGEEERAGRQRPKRGRVREWGRGRYSQPQSNVTSQKPTYLFQSIHSFLAQPMYPNSILPWLVPLPN